MALEKCVFCIRNISKRKQTSEKKRAEHCFDPRKQNCMRNLERFWQSSILSKNPTALFPPNPSIIKLIFVDISTLYFCLPFWTSSIISERKWKLKFTGPLCKWFQCCFPVLYTVTGMQSNPTPIWQSVINLSPAEGFSTCFYLYWVASTLYEATSHLTEVKVELLVLFNYNSYHSSG